MNLLAFLDELRVLAQNGLHYAGNDYDQARYERMLELVSEAYNHSLDVPAVEVRDRLARELGHVTPKIGADAAVFDDQDRMLLVRRSDDGCWGLPGGWVEPSESPEETAVRETLEETGLEVRVIEQLGAIHRLPSDRNGPHGVLSVVYLAEIAGGEPTPSAETPEVSFRDVDDVTAWHTNHRQLAQVARESWTASRMRDRA